MPVIIENLIEDLNLKVLNEGEEKKAIVVSDINRPGLQLSGFYNYFSKDRIQVLGRAEWSFLDTMKSDLRSKRLAKFFKYDTPCNIIAVGLKPHEELIKNAKIHNRWILGTEMKTTRFINKVMTYLDYNLAPVTRMHGVLVDVYGIGVLIIGESGIGKSETALELVKRGHRLVADDAVDFKKIDEELQGTAPFITSGMMEVRGMGIIDVAGLYGFSSILKKKVLHLVVDLTQWNDDENYDRLGIDDEFINILTLPIKKVRIPIRPGRNVAVIIEAAAANHRYSFIAKINTVSIIEERMRLESMKE